MSLSSARHHPLRSKPVVSFGNRDFLFYETSHTNTQTQGSGTATLVTVSEPKSSRSSSTSTRSLPPAALKYQKTGVDEKSIQYSRFHVSSGHFMTSTCCFEIGSDDIVKWVKDNLATLSDSLRMLPKKANQVPQFATALMQPFEAKIVASYPEESDQPEEPRFSRCFAAKKQLDLFLFPNSLRLKFQSPHQPIPKLTSVEKFRSRSGRSSFSSLRNPASSPSD